MAHFTTTRRVEFCETDMAGIVHFANYYRYMEQAEHDFFRSLNLKMVGEKSDGFPIGWPRVNAICEYRSPARYEDLLTIEVTILKLTTRSLAIEYRFFIEGRPVATGEMTTVCCKIHSEGIQAIEIPPFYASALKQCKESLS